MTDRRQRLRSRSESPQSTASTLREICRPRYARSKPICNSCKSERPRAIRRPLRESTKSAEALGPSQANSQASMRAEQDCHRPRTHRRGRRRKCVRTSAITQAMTCRCRSTFIGVKLADTSPEQWTVVTRDLFQECKSDGQSDGHCAGLPRRRLRPFGPRLSGPHASKISTIARRKRCRFRSGSRNSFCAMAAGMPRRWRFTASRTAGTIGACGFMQDNDLRPWRNWIAHRSSENFLRFFSGPRKRESPTISRLIRTSPPNAKTYRNVSKRFAPGVLTPLVSASVSATARYRPDGSAGVGRAQNATDRGEGLSPLPRSERAASLRSGARGCDGNLRRTAGSALLRGDFQLEDSRCRWRLNWGPVSRDQGARARRAWRSRRVGPVDEPCGGTVGGTGSGH